ncbi:hypothetical protein GCM10010129_80240 [Streptomyces fumigatiscleroticus]|nr:hypothetical protein GCM10010129_80240 [Streptomyces fumigatiscleroticus]
MYTTKSSQSHRIVVQDKEGLSLITPILNGNIVFPTRTLIKTINKRGKHFTDFMGVKCYNPKMVNQLCLLSGLTGDVFF